MLRDVLLSVNQRDKVHRMGNPERHGDDGDEGYEAGGTVERAENHSRPLFV